MLGGEPASGHHPCGGVKVGGREPICLEARLEPVSLALLLGRWASSCGRGCSPSSPGGGRGASPGLGRASQPDGRTICSPLSYPLSI